MNQHTNIFQDFNFFPENKGLFFYAENQNKIHSILILNISFFFKLEKPGIIIKSINRLKSL